MITQKLLHELFDYNPETGIMINRVDRNHNALVGDFVGSVNNHGYLQTKIDYKSYKVHRLIWCYVYGEIPSDHIDHINHDRCDNRIENLRLVTRIKQSQNVSRRKDNVSGQVGVSWEKRACMWRADITVAGKRCFLGY